MKARDFRCGDIVGLEGVAGQGIVTGTFEGGMAVDWGPGFGRGLLYDEPRMISNTSRLYRVGGAANTVLQEKP